MRAYSHQFDFEGHVGWGYNFPCDEKGRVQTEFITPEARQNYQACLTGEVNGRKVIDRGIVVSETALNLCSCGSGQERYPLYDARGIFCTYVCGACEAEKRSHYRVDVMEDPSYYANEPIEAEDY